MTDPREADAPLLTARQIRHQFISGSRRVQALDGVDVQVFAGQITGLIGPDGAGKTTLMRRVVGLHTPQAGECEVLGIAVEANPLAVQARVGYMPQRFGLYEDLSVQENLDLYADLQGVPRAQRTARYDELMGMTGLAPFTARLAGRLSGGMKQKLGLACTLVRPPRLLLLDEPTVGVDPVSRRELWAIVQRLVRDEGMGVLVSTAYLDEAERCHRVFLIHEGRMLGDATPEAFNQRMQGRSYLASAPNMPPRALLEALSHTPGLVDAIIQGGHVRMVVAEGAVPRVDELPKPVPELKIDPAKPDFEDFFVAELRRQGAGQGTANSVAPAEISNVGGALPTVVDRTSPGADQPVIDVDKVWRRFGAFAAVKGISFSVAHGEIFGLLGANGAGKSTTFRMLCGLLPPSAGQLRVAGYDLLHAAAVARGRIGYMSQKFSLYGNLSVVQNLAFFSAAYGLRGRWRRQRIDWALDSFQLRDERSAMSGDLPLGYKQRLALACALMHEPDVLFLDEPTSGVDPLARRAFWQRINGLAERRVTVLVTTHFMEEAEYCDRIAIMQAGEMLALGTPAEIKDRLRREGERNLTLEDAFIRLIEAPADHAA